MVKDKPIVKVSMGILGLGGGLFGYLVRAKMAVKGGPFRWRWGGTQHWFSMHSLPFFFWGWDGDRRCALSRCPLWQRNGGAGGGGQGRRQPLPGADIIISGPGRPRASPGHWSTPPPNTLSGILCGPNLLPRWQPSLQLKSPYLWPLLNMCSSSESNTPERKSGRQSLFLSRAEHASQRAVPGSFCGSYALVSADMICFLSRILCIEIGGGEGTVTWGMFPRGSEDTVTRRRLPCKGGGGGLLSVLHPPPQAAAPTRQPNNRSLSTIRGSPVHFTCF